MSPGIPLVALGAVVWFGLLVFGLAMFRTAGRRTPAPPARPRTRLIQSRENVGIVEILPNRDEARR